MVSPSVSIIFQIGVDNALIQVPQNYTVPANPPSEPNPPNNLATSTSNLQNTTTSDSVTIYLSAIKGFNNPLSMSVLIQPMTSSLANSLGFALDDLDSTIAPWVGKIGITSVNWLPATSMVSTPTGLQGPLPFTMNSNTGNALNTYVVHNYQTLWINPGVTGGSINPSHPPSYLITIFATDPITNTYAACNFTLVIIPSQANYGLGVYSKAQIGEDYTYINSVTLQPNGFAIGAKMLIDYFFYPLEPLPKAPTPLDVSINIFNSQIIDLTNSSVVTAANRATGFPPPPLPTPVPLSTFGYTGAVTSYGVDAVADNFSRDSLSPVVNVAGTATASVATVLTDSSLALVPNSLIGALLNYTSGPAAGQYRQILANTPTMITTSAFSPAPDASGDTFLVFSSVQYGSGYVEIALYLNPISDFTVPTNRHALLQLTATDQNNVSVSAYTAIYVAGAGA